MVSVKESVIWPKGVLAGKGNAEAFFDGQARAGAMKPDLIKALIQRGALR